MSLIKLDSNQKRILSILTIFSILFGVYFLRNFIMLIIFAAIMAILFNPIHEWLIKKGNKKGTAGLYTFALSSLVIILPVVVISVVTFFQIQNLVDKIAGGNYTLNITSLSQDLLNSLNSMISNFGFDYTLTTDEVVNSVKEAATSFGRILFDQLISTFSGVFGFLTAAIIYIYVFMSMLLNKGTILKTIRRLNPLGNEVSELYMGRIGAMTKATVRGQFIIAFAQGLISAIVLTIVGPSNFFFLYLLLLTIMSVIPLGAGIIIIPIGLFLIVTGNIWGGIIVIANHFLVVTNIDNILRPILVPKNARLDPALMILAVFAGLGLFGFLGIVIGPVIMILIVTTIQIYNEVFYKEDSIDRSKSDKKSLFDKVKNLSK